MEINIQNLIDDARCYEAVGDLRWPGKTFCPHCDSDDIITSEAKMILNRTNNVTNVSDVISDLMI